PKGNAPYWTVFHELLIATGTIRTFGTFLIIVAIPPPENGLILADLALVPSGKMTADQFRSFMRFANFRISAIDCLLSFRSMFAPPPCLRLKEMLGIPLVSSIFEINFAWCFLRKKIKGGISYML